MDKRIILAVAGAGKTYTLCNCLNSNERNMVLAFTNRNIYNIQRELIKQYGTIPEYLWNDLPDSAILRNDNGKWYAVFMNLEGFKIGLDTKDRVDIMVVKCKPDMISVMTHMKGFLPGYYMDKSNWMTILLQQRIL